MPSSVNEFIQPTSYDHEIGKAGNGTKVGTVRIKASSILWKPKGAHSWHSVSLDEFAEWMKDKPTVAK